MASSLLPHFLLERFQMLAIVSFFEWVGFLGRPASAGASSPTTASVAGGAGPAIARGFHRLPILFYEFQDGIEAFLSLFVGQLFFLCQTFKLLGEFLLLTVGELD